MLRWMYWWYCWYCSLLTSRVQIRSGRLSHKSVRDVGRTVIAQWNSPVSAGGGSWQRNITSPGQINDGVKSLAILVLIILSCQFWFFVTSSNSHAEPQRRTYSMFSFTRPVSAQPSYLVGCWQLFVGRGEERRGEALPACGQSSTVELQALSNNYNGCSSPHLTSPQLTSHLLLQL